MEIETGTSTGGEAGGEGGGEGGGGEATPNVADVFGGKLEEMGGRLTEFGGRFDDLGARLEAIEAGGGPAGEEDTGGGEEFEPQFGVEDYNEDGELTVAAQTRAIREIASRQVAEALAPHHAQQNEQRRMQYADALEEKYPDLGTEEVQNEVFERAGQQAALLAQITGKPELAELALEPEFLEVVYLAGQAQKSADREIPAGSEREVTIEGGSSAGPASGSGGGDEGDSIVARATQGRYRLGS